MPEKKSILHARWLQTDIIAVDSSYRVCWKQSKKTPVKVAESCGTTLSLNNVYVAFTGLG